MAQHAPSLASATPGSPPRTTRLRFLPLLVIAADLALVGAHVAHYPQLFDALGAAGYVTEPTIMLLLYVPLWLWLTSLPGESRRDALDAGLLIGAITGLLEIVDITLETFVDLSGAASLL